MPRSLAALAAFAAIALAACGGTDEPATPSGKLDADLTYVRDGRDGVHREVTVRPNHSGTLLVEGDDKPAQTAFTLTPAEFKRIAELTSEADLGSVDSPDHDADANHTFVLTYGDTKVTWDEEERPEGLEQLTSRMFDLLERYKD
jgi:hypothetical protein